MSATIPNRSASLAQGGFWVMAALFCFAVITSLPNRSGAQSQQRGTTTTATSSPIIPDMDPFDLTPNYDGDPARAQMNEKRLQALNVERQKSMVAETNRLVKLATDLNTQINSEKHSQLTADQLRQLAEIEKLAHRIRERMSAAMMNPPPMNEPPRMIPIR